MKFQCWIEWKKVRTQNGLQSSAVRINVIIISITADSIESHRRSEKVSYRCVYFYALCSPQKILRIGTKTHTHHTHIVIFMHLKRFIWFSLQLIQFFFYTHQTFMITFNLHMCECIRVVRFCESRTVPKAGFEKMLSACLDWRFMWVSLHLFFVFFFQIRKIFWDIYQRSPNLLYTTNSWRTKDFSDDFNFLFWKFCGHY